MNNTNVNSTVSTTSITSSTTTPLLYLIPPGVWNRLWLDGYNLSAYAIGSIISLILFIVCYRKIKEAYIILILNQLFIAFAFSFLQLIGEFFITDLLTAQVFAEIYSENPNPFWTTLLYLMSAIGNDLYYALLMSNLLLCINRVVAMYTHNGINRWMNKKYNIVYCIIGYFFVPIVSRTFELYNRYN